MVDDARHARRQADSFAALEAQYAAQRSGDDPAAYELCRWARRSRERIEASIAAAEKPATDPNQTTLFKEPTK